VRGFKIDRIHPHPNLSVELTAEALSLKGERVFERIFP
jgi:hypothetical protein